MNRTALCTLFLFAATSACSGGESDPPAPGMLASGTYVVDSFTVVQNECTNLGFLDGPGDEYALGVDGDLVSIGFGLELTLSGNNLSGSTTEEWGDPDCITRDTDLWTGEVTAPNHFTLTDRYTESYVSGDDCGSAPLPCTAITTWTFNKK